ncbi:MAG: thioredoxin [Candidatus Marinimicrobia bacterium]|nr:thioredoxin [Candidatus Neomarinimicrobiota bacterium]
MPVTLTDATWNQEIDQHQGLALVDIWAPWCGPCHIIGPVVEEIATEYEGRAKVGKLNADENRKPGEFGVTGIPTLLIFRDGKLVDSIVGAVPKNMITERLDYHLTAETAQS